MVDNLSFLRHVHRCVVCQEQIDMKKVDKYVSECMRMQHSSRPMPSDPIIVDDFGNDVNIVCCSDCYIRFIGLE